MCMWSSPYREVTHQLSVFWITNLYVVIFAAHICKILIQRKISQRSSRTSPFQCFKFKRWTFVHWTVKPAIVTPLEMFQINITPSYFSEFGKVRVMNEMWSLRCKSVLSFESHDFMNWLVRCFSTNSYQWSNCSKRPKKSANWTHVVFFFSPKNCHFNQCG